MSWMGPAGGQPPAWLWSAAKSWSYARRVSPVRLRPLSSAELTAVLTRLDAAEAGGYEADADDVRAAVKHFLAVLAGRHPGKSVEVRVPPYAAVQCIEGARHTRGTPPAVVETRAAVWLRLARGQVSFREAVEGGDVLASGERSDLSDHLPLG
jgi:hypothetical protein